MALLGMMKKQMFGQVPQANMAPMQAYGDGDFGPEQQQPMQQPMQQARKKPSILGLIGDSLQILGGGQATYVPQMQEQRQRAELMRQKQMMESQDRETGWQDWVRKQEYERANPAPANNDTANDLALWEKWTPDQRRMYREMHPIVQTMSDGTQRLFDPTQSGQTARSGPAIGAIEDGHRFKGGNPSDPNAWEKIGGQMQPASGNFPAPRY